MSDLRSQVLWSSTESLHSGCVSDALFTQTKVCDLDVSIFVQHQVLQLRTQQTKQCTSLDHTHSTVTR